MDEFVTSPRRGRTRYDRSLNAEQSTHSSRQTAPPGTNSADISDAEIARFVEIWKHEFGETITAERARVEAGLLLELYWQLAQLLPSEIGYNGPRQDP